MKEYYRNHLLPQCLQHVSGSPKMTLKKYTNTFYTNELYGSLESKINVHDNQKCSHPSDITEPMQEMQKCCGLSDRPGL